MKFDVSGAMNFRGGVSKFHTWDLSDSASNLMQVKNVSGDQHCFRFSNSDFISKL